MRRSIILAVGLVLTLLTVSVFAQRGITNYMTARLAIEKTGAITIKPKTGQAVTVAGNPLVVPKKYVALLTQTSTSAPTATVLENSLGVTPTYAYSDTGVYEITSATAFADNKVALNAQQWQPNRHVSLNYEGGGVFTLSQVDLAGAAADGLTRVRVEIIVYP